MMMTTSQAMAVTSQQSLSSSSYNYENMYNTKYYKSFHGVSGNKHSDSPEKSTSKCKLTTNLSYKRSDSHATSVNSRQPRSLTTAGLLKESNRSSSSPCLDDVAHKDTGKPKTYCTRTNIRLSKSITTQGDSNQACPYAISVRPQITKTLPGMYETARGKSDVGSSVAATSPILSHPFNTNKKNVTNKLKSSTLQQRNVSTPSSVLSKESVGSKAVENAFSSVQRNFETRKKVSDGSIVGMSKLSEAAKSNKVADLKNKFDTLCETARHEELSINPKSEPNKKINTSISKQSTKKNTPSSIKSSVTNSTSSKLLKSSTLPDCSVTKKYQADSKTSKPGDNETSSKKVSCVKLAVRNFERSISDSTHEQPKASKTESQKSNSSLKDKNCTAKVASKTSEKNSGVPIDKTVSPFTASMFQRVPANKTSIQPSLSRISTKLSETGKTSPKSEATAPKLEISNRMCGVNDTKENCESISKPIQTNVSKKNASALHDRIMSSSQVKKVANTTLSNNTASAPTKIDISLENANVGTAKTNPNPAKCQGGTTDNRIQIERQVKICQKVGMPRDEQKLKKIPIKNKKVDPARAKLGKPPDPPKNSNFDKIPLPQPRRSWTDKLQPTYCNNLKSSVSKSVTDVAPPLPLKLVNLEGPKESSKNVISSELAKACDKKSKSLPNSSFLWNYKETLALSNETLDVLSVGSPDQNRVDSGDYFEDPYVCEEPIIEYASTSIADEPIYMEANFLGTKNIPDHPSSAAVYAYRDVTNLQDRDKDSGESDEGWVDISENELDHSSALKAPSRPKLRKKQGNKKGNLKRLSWSHSFQRLNKNSESPQEEYQDVHDWDMIDAVSISSYADSVDHQYEALYDIINQSSIVADVGKLEPSDDSIPQLPERDHSPLPKIKNKTVSKDSGIGEYKSNTMDGCLNDDSNGDSAGTSKAASGDKINRIKRNWSLTKSDIRLELISRWNRMKPKKTSRSAAEIVSGQTEIKSMENDKKNLEIRLIPSQQTKLTYSSPLVSPSSPTEETAQFYIKCTDSEDSTQTKSERPKSESFTLDCPDADAEKNSRPRRRVSLKSVSRPTVPPPKPPMDQSMFYVSSCRSSTASSSTNSDSKSSYDAIWVNPDLQSGVNSYLLKSSSESSVPVTKSAGIMERQDSSFSSIRINSSALHSKNPESSNSDVNKNEDQYLPVMIDKCKKPSNLNLNATKGVRKMSAETIVDELNLLFPTTQGASKSPINEEPLYQFYQEHMKQRTSQWNNMSDGSGSEPDYGYHYEKMEDDCVKENANTSGSEVSTNRQISAMEIVKSEVKMQTLWCDIPEVKASGLLEKLTTQERKLQEAIFEVMTSEASYLKSLDVLVNHFMSCPEFVDEFSTECVIDRHDKHVLFSDVLPVYEVSQRLLAEFEKHWQEDIRLSKICDILNEHASKYFGVYVKYCSNQLYQDRQYNHLKNTKPEFVEVLKKLESSPVCQCLSFHSFLMLPMQRITRLPLLVDAIYHRLEAQTYEFEAARDTLSCLNKIVAECNEGARKMERMEEMLRISQLINFKDCKGIPLISPTRWLVKKGELIRLNFNEGSAKIPFSKTTKCSKMPVYLFLFTDLLIITKQKGDGSFTVIDYCPRNMVQVLPIDGANTQKLPCRPPEGSKNLFQCTMLQNHEGKTVELVFCCNLESERTRWMEAVTPPTSENPDEKIYEEWDCPQVQVVHSYQAQQPDELTLEEADVVNVFRKMADGWYQGERIRDGIEGWFPANHTEEIVSSHVRARNLRQRYRLLALSHSYLLKNQKSRSK